MIFNRDTKYSIIIYLRDAQERYISRPYTAGEIELLQISMDKSSMAFIEIGANAWVSFLWSNLINMVIVPYVEPVV